MTAVLDLDYTDSDDAWADYTLWAKSSVTVAVSSPTVSLTITASANVASATRQITGLTAGTPYTVTLATSVFSGANFWSMTVAGQSVPIASEGEYALEFTATGETENLVVGFNGTRSGSTIARLAGLTVSGEDVPAGLVLTGARSHLHDKVEILAWPSLDVLAEIPAYVGTSTARLDVGSGRVEAVAGMQVITPVFDFNPDGHVIRWRGVVYNATGPAMLRTRRGRDHHLTIPIGAAV